MTTPIPAVPEAMTRAEYRRRLAQQQPVHGRPAAQPVGGEPVAQPIVTPVAQPIVPAPLKAKRWAGLGKRAAGAASTAGVMAAVGLLALGTTTPASAVAAVSSVAAVSAVASTSGTDATTETDEPEPIQAYVSSAAAAPVTLERSTDTFEVASVAQDAAAVAAASGVTQTDGSWVNDPTAAIQWPFPVGVPVSAAYGSGSYLSTFGTPHHGVDLIPGAGAAIHAIAAGTVRVATQSGGDYGVTVVIDHTVDGQLVSSRYAHMQYGSLTVSVGDTVAAGDIIGAVGQTGKATGPHLHLEILLGGTTRTDPMTWLRAHTG